MTTHDQIVLSVGLLADKTGPPCAPGIHQVFRNQPQVICGEEVWTQ
jgi:hypothetical protein